jgi:purine catabolism regulator
MTTSQITLKELLRLSFPLSLLGSIKIDQRRIINWVVSSGEEAMEDDLLIILGSRVTPEIIEQAKTRKVAAMLVFGDVPNPGWLNVHSLPIIQIADESIYREKQRQLMTTILNHRVALIERGVRIHAKLTKLAAEGAGLEGLIRLMSEISRRGVVIQDKRLCCLASSSPLPLKAIWDDVIEHLGKSDNLPEPFLDRKQAGQSKQTIRQGISGGLVRLITPIIVRQVARGYLSVISEQDDLDDLDYLVIEQGASVCALEMARTKSVREAEKRLKGDLLTALLHEDLASRDVRLWIQAMGLDLSQAHVAIRFSWSGESTPSQRRLETLVNGEISRLEIKAIVREMDEEIVCFCQVDASNDRPQSIIAFGRAVLSESALEYSDSPAKCGIGKPVSELTLWRISFRQAGQALKMARRLDEVKPFYFPDLSVYRLLLQLENNAELIGFQEEILGALLAYEGAGEFIRTLEAFFENKGNLSQTSESLFIHRNTLIYRLDRISKITSLDLDNPDTRLAVQLAVRIYRMMGSE